MHVQLSVSNFCVNNIDASVCSEANLQSDLLMKRSGYTWYAIERKLF